MKLFGVVFASVLTSTLAFAETIKTYHGKSSLPPHQCEFKLRTSDDGKIIGYFLKGPGELTTNFGACEETCPFPDLDSDMLEPSEFQRYGFRVIYANTYPQVTMVSRFVKEKTDIIFVSRQLELDLNEGGSPDELRFFESTEAGTMRMNLKTINCDHLEEVK